MFFWKSLQAAEFRGDHVAYYREQKVEATFEETVEKGGYGGELYPG